jgi:hypothetical protein
MAPRRHQAGEPYQDRCVDVKGILFGFKEDL